MLGGKLSIERMHFVEKAIVAIAKNKIVNESIDVKFRFLFLTRRSFNMSSRANTQSSRKTEGPLLTKETSSYTWILSTPLLMFYSVPLFNSKMM